MAEFSYELLRDEQTREQGFPQRRPVVDEHFGNALRKAIAATRQFFFDHQHPDGYWVAELEGDVSLESETVLLLAFLGEEESEPAGACAKSLVEKQLPDGGWGRYHGAEADVNNTVKAYFALKLAGHDPSTESMRRARNKAKELGGLERVDGLTRFFLAILGQIPHSACPVVPSQVLLLPKGSSLGIYDMSAWTRTLFVPLAIISALAPVREIPAEKGVRELLLSDPKDWKTLELPDRPSSVFSWSYASSLFPQGVFSRTCDRMMKLCRRIGLTPLRRRGIRAAERWMLEHLRNSDGLGASFPSIAWGWIALKALGYTENSPEIVSCREQVESLLIRDVETGHVRIQPGKTPVRDTTRTLKALMLGGLTTDHPCIRKAVRWLRERQIREDGDWARKTKAAPGGWCREFDNAFYPNNDDTAMVLMVLAGRFDETGTETDRSSPARPGVHTEDVLSENILPPDLRLMSHDQGTTMAAAKIEALDMTETAEALERGLKWLLAMQNRDGGWAAFDRNNVKKRLCRAPFSGREASFDPSTPDLSGRVLEALGRLGFRYGKNRQVDKAVGYLRKTQQSDGSWSGRWGINAFYGTWQALTGLTAVGVSVEDPVVQAGANWLLSHQQPCGGWGETPESYEVPSLRGSGEPTASQTAWAVMGLIAAGKAEHPATLRGIRFLVNRQRSDGTWEESRANGVDLSGGAFLKYHYDSVYFPLMALSLFAAKTRRSAALAASKETARTGIRVFAPESESYNNVRFPQPSALKLYLG